MRVARWLLGLIVATGLLLAGWECFRQNTWVSYGYHVEARFATLPPDDKALCAWLKAQPHVVGHLVSVCREGPDGKLLKVFFTQTRNVAGYPPFPLIDERCAELDYVGAESPFRSSPGDEQALCFCE